MNMAGHEVGGLRLPLVEASEDEAAVIRVALERHGLLARFERTARSGSFRSAAWGRSART